MRSRPRSAPRGLRSPVRDGKLKAMHCMEIPFVFDNPDAGKPMTGSGEDRYALAAKVSAAPQKN